MAIDFMTALRASRLSREIANRARLAGRGVSPSEASAPYEAAAQTASARTQQRQNYALQQQQIGLQGQSLAQQKELTQAQLAQQQGQFTASNLLERDRLQAQMEANEASLTEQKRVTDAEMAAAKKAGKMNWIQTGIEAPFTAYRGYQILKDLWPSGGGFGGAEAAMTGTGDIAPTLTGGMDTAPFAMGTETPSVFGAGELGEIIPSAYSPSVGGAGASAAAYTGGMTAGEAELAGIGAQAGMAGESAVGGGAAGAGLAEGGAAAFPTTAAGWLGPIATVAMPVIGALTSMAGRRKTQHAQEDWRNSQEGKTYFDQMDVARQSWTQNTFARMSPAERENLVKSEIAKMYEGGFDPSGTTMVGGGNYSSEVPQAINQFGSLFLPPDEAMRYQQMFIEAQRKYEQGLYSRWGSMAWGAGSGSAGGSGAAAGAGSGAD